MEIKQVTNSTQLSHMTSPCQCRTLKSNFKKLPFHIIFIEPADFEIFLNENLNENVLSIESIGRMLTGLCNYCHDVLPVHFFAYLNT